VGVRTIFTGIDHAVLVSLLCNVTTMTNMISISINACVDADSPAARAILLALGAAYSAAPATAPATATATIPATAPAIATATIPATVAEPVVTVVARVKSKPTPPVAPVAPVVPEPPQQETVVAAVVTEADLRAAMKMTIDAVGYTAVEQVFQKIGAKKMSDIRSSGYSSAIAALAKAREVAQ